MYIQASTEEEGGNKLKTLMCTELLQNSTQDTEHTGTAEHHTGTAEHTGTGTRVSAEGTAWLRVHKFRQYFGALFYTDTL